VKLQTRKLWADNYVHFSVQARRYCAANSAAISVAVDVPNDSSPAVLDAKKLAGVVE